MSGKSGTETKCLESHLRRKLIIVVEFGGFSHRLSSADECCSLGKTSVLGKAKDKRTLVCVCWCVLMLCSALKMLFLGGSYCSNRSSAPCSSLCGFRASAGLRRSSAPAEHDKRNTATCDATLGVCLVLCFCAFFFFVCLLVVCVCS